MSMYLLNYIYLKNIPSGLKYKSFELIITNWQIYAVFAFPKGLSETITMVSYSAGDKRSLLRRLNYGTWSRKV